MGPVIIGAWVGALVLFSAAPSTVIWASTPGIESVLASSECSSFGDLRRAVVSPNEEGSFGISGIGSVEPSLLPAAIFSHYRQTRYKFTDVIGDFALLKKITPTIQSKKKKALAQAEVTAIGPCARAFFGITADNSLEAQVQPLAEASLGLFERDEHIEQIEKLPVPTAEKARLLEAYHAGRLNLEGHMDPFRSKELNEMLLEVMAEEYHQNGTVAGLGKPQGWSPEVIKRTGSLPGFLRMSKLLTALSLGVTSAYFVTGGEQALVTWMLEQPLRSIRLSELFRELPDPFGRRVPHADDDRECAFGTVEDPRARKAGDVSAVGLAAQSSGASGQQYGELVPFDWPCVVWLRSRWICGSCGGDSRADRERVPYEVRGSEPGRFRGEARRENGVGASACGGKEDVHDDTGEPGVLGAGAVRGAA
jgi:hypothetical protein